MCKFLPVVKRILLTGMSGTGKSAVVGGLLARGYMAVDTDYGWCETSPDGEWIWDEQKIDALLTNEIANLLFVAGCASNQGKFYRLFDLVILLSAPRDLMVNRISGRHENPFGKSSEELSRILRDLEMVEPQLRLSADFEIRTDRPLGEVVEEVVVLSMTA